MGRVGGGKYEAVVPVVTRRACVPARRTSDQPTRLAAWRALLVAAGLWLYP